MIRMVLSVAAAVAAVAVAATAQERLDPRAMARQLDPVALAALAKLGAPGQRVEPGTEALPEAQKMRASFAASEAAIEALDCGDGRCEIAVELDASKPETFAERLYAVEQWVATASPCGYSVVLPEIAAEGRTTVRMTIDCGS